MKVRDRRADMTAEQAQVAVSQLLREEDIKVRKHTEGYAKKNVEKLRKEIKALTGMGETVYKKWLDKELKARKEMGMGWSDYDLYLQAKIERAKLSQASKPIATGGYKKIPDDSRWFKKESIINPKMTTIAYFSLPSEEKRLSMMEEAIVDKTKPKQVRGIVKPSYKEYILFREIEQSKFVETVVKKTIVKTDPKTGKEFQYKETTSKFSIYRDNWMKGFDENIYAGGGNAVKKWFKIRPLIERMSNVEFEKLSNRHSMTVYYEEMEVRSRYSVLLDEIFDDIKEIIRESKRNENVEKAEV